MCIICGEIHKGSLVTSLNSLDDYEVLEEVGAHCIRVREIILTLEKIGYGNTYTVEKHTVELSHEFYKRMC